MGILPCEVKPVGVPPAIVDFLVAKIVSDQLKVPPTLEGNDREVLEQFQTVATKIEWTLLSNGPEYLLLLCEVMNTD